MQHKITKIHRLTTFCDLNIRGFAVISRIGPVPFERVNIADTRPGLLQPVNVSHCDVGPSDLEL